MTLNEAAEQILRAFRIPYDEKPSSEVEAIVEVGMRERILPILRQLAQTEYQRGYLQAINKKEIKELAIVDRKAELPSCPDYLVKVGYDAVYKMAQQDILNAGWVKEVTDVRDTSLY